VVDQRLAKTKIRPRNFICKATAGRRGMMLKDLRDLPGTEEERKKC